ncbi:MAG: EAL domain-containing protein [Gemmatimonadaceae bacterium]|nr:EAL domain-containing protein [Gemmatimonadaceae bacterium]
MTNSPLFHSARRDSGGALVAPLGSVFLWLPSPQALAKVVSQLRRVSLDVHILEGDGLQVDVEWEVLRDLVVPLRRVLTHAEAEDTKVLYKPAGGALSTNDFARVQTYTQFSRVSQSSWLHEMIDQSRLTSVLQPIVFAADPTRVFAREALLRGVGRDDAVVYPNYIFDAARGCGMLMQIDLASRKAAIDRMVLDGMREKLFINLTPSAIDDPLATLEHTVRMIDDAGIAHDRIVFEVVESEHAGDVPNLRGLLDSYRRAGFRVALDDVGAGYSSLNLLHQLRPDFVKLDMGLIRGVHADPYKGIIASKILEIATDLGVETIAEGVETEGELAWVREHGAHYAQGFAIARPGVPALHDALPVRPPAPGMMS